MPDIHPRWRPLVCRFQGFWLISCGMLMLFAPQKWWGNAWAIINNYIAWPYLIGSLYVGLGVVIWFFANSTNGLPQQQKELGGALLVGGILSWVIGIFFVLSAFESDFSIMAGPFPLYVGGHMLIGSALAFARVGEIE